MVRFTEEELLEYKEHGVVSQPQVLESFNKMIDVVREKVEAAQVEYDKRQRVKWGNGDTYIDEHGNERSYQNLNRRRPSRATAERPNLRKKRVEQVETDSDGWTTFAKPKKSFGQEQVSEREKFRESHAKETAIRVKPNNKNLGSSKAADPRDITAEKQTITFNAFDALGDEEDI